MCANQWFTTLFLACSLALSGVAGCGGSSDDDDDSPPAPEDFALGEGDVTAQWSSNSTELIHDLSRGVLYYLNPDDLSVGNQDVIAVKVDSGDAAPLFSGRLLFDPSKIRMTTDSDELYVLESKESAGVGGFPLLIRYSLSGDYIYEGFSEIDPGVVVDDFVPTTNDRFVLATHTATVSSTPTEQHLSLINSFNGVEIDSQTFPGVVQSLALSWDQTTVLDQIMLGSNLAASTLSIANDALALQGTRTLTLGEAAINTYEPEGDRVFRSNGTVWDGDETLNLGSYYESIDFDLNKDRIVILVRSSSGYIIRYFDRDSLALLSEQTLPTIDEAAGMEPVKLFVDDSDLYVVYRQAGSTLLKNYALVEFNYP